MSFYSVLGVSFDATADDVRRAYKKLALQLHPDKKLASPQPSASAATFAEVNEAYEVLSEPRRREIYDAFGYEGLRLYEGAYQLARASRATGTVLPPIMLVTTLAAATTLVALLLLLLVLLAALRFDGEITAPWPLLFAPLWLADPLLLLVLALVLAEAPGQLWPAVQRLLPPFALLLCFQALLCAKLQRPTDLSWLAVFAPLLIGARGRPAHARAPSSLPPSPFHALGLTLRTLSAALRLRRLLARRRVELRPLLLAAELQCEPEGHAERGCGQKQGRRRDLGCEVEQSARERRTS